MAANAKVSFQNAPSTVCKKGIVTSSSQAFNFGKKFLSLLKRRHGVF